MQPGVGIQRWASVRIISRIAALPAESQQPTSATQLVVLLLLFSTAFGCLTGLFFKITPD